MLPKVAKASTVLSCHESLLQAVSQKTFVLHHPKVPSQVAKLIGIVAAANVLAKTSIPG
jgi:hypothetical protein